MISITGVTGFIGKNLIKHLIEKGLQIRALIRNPSKLGSELRFTEIVKGDIRDKKTAEYLVKDCHCLIHLANVYQTNVSNLDEMNAVNVESSKILFQKAVECGVQRILYMSSAGVHQHLNTVIDESAPLRTDSDDPYEIQKIACERVLSELSQKKDVETVILRPATVYGPGDWRLAPLFNMIQSRRFFFIGNGNNFVSWVYIDDVVRAIETAIEHPAAAGQAYIITGPDEMTLRQLVSKIAAFSKVETPSISFPVLPFLIAAKLCEKIFPLSGMRPPITKARLRFFTDSLRYSSEKIKKELNVSFNTAIEEGLKKILIKNEQGV